jgi:hypothetical protein
MEWLRIGIVTLALLPSLALAQEEPALTTVVGGDQINPASQPDAVPTVPATSASSEPPPPDPEPWTEDPETGWAVLGAELGLGLGLTGFAALSASTGDWEIMGGGVLPSLLLAGGGALLFGSLAGEGDWSPGVGWALASLVPTAFYGMLAAALAAEMSEQVDRERGVALAIGAGVAATVAAPFFAYLGEEGRGGLALMALVAGILGGAFAALPIGLACEDATPLLVGALLGGAIEATVLTIATP